MPYSSLLTPPGRGAVATIRFAGSATAIDDAGLFRAAHGGPLAEQPLGRLIYGHWGPPPGEQVVLCRLAEPQLEIHAHGGHAACGAILTDLASLGAEQRDCWDVLERTEGRFAREGAEALAAASTPRAAALIAHQIDGPLREALTALAKEPHPHMMEADLAELLEELWEWAQFGRHLTQPWQVVLYGRPNVGKSSLVNALAGFERAIVLDSPGTTRDLVSAEIALEGWPIQLTDTAGLRPAPESLEAAGIQRARARMAHSDLRILVLDRSTPPTEEDRALLAETAPDLLVANKADLPDAWGAALPGEALVASARAGQGFADLTRAIVQRLVPIVPEPRVPIPVTPGQIQRLETAREALAQGDWKRTREQCRRLL